MTTARKTEIDDLSKKKIRVKTIQLVARIIDSLGISAFFSLSMAAFYLTLEVGSALLLMGLNFLVSLPGAAILNWIQAGLAFREAQLKKWKPHPVIRLVLETASALAITSTVLIGAFVLTNLFYTMTPIVFASVMGARAIYNLGAGLYNLSKAIASTEKRQKHIEKAVQNLVSAGAYAMLTIGIIFTFAAISVTPVTGIVLGCMAIAAGVIAASVSVFKLVRTHSRDQIPPELIAESNTQKREQTPSTRAFLGNTLGFSADKPVSSVKEQIPAVKVETSKESGHDPDSAPEYVGRRLQPS